VEVETGNKIENKNGQILMHIYITVKPFELWPPLYKNHLYEAIKAHFMTHLVTEITSVQDYLFVKTIICTNKFIIMP